MTDGNNTGWANFGKSVALFGGIAAGIAVLIWIGTTIHHEGVRSGTWAAADKAREEQQRLREHHSAALAEESRKALTAERLSQALNVFVGACLSNTACRQAADQTQTVSVSNREATVCFEDSDGYHTARLPLSFDGSGNVQRVGSPRFENATGMYACRNATY